MRCAIPAVLVATLLAAGPATARAQSFPLVPMPPGAQAWTFSGCDVGYSCISGLFWVGNLVEHGYLSGRIGVEATITYATAGRNNAVRPDAASGLAPFMRDAALDYSLQHWTGTVFRNFSDLGRPFTDPVSPQLLSFEQWYGTSIFAPDFERRDLVVALTPVPEPATV